MEPTTNGDHSDGGAAVATPEAPPAFDAQAAPSWDTEPGGNESQPPRGNLGGGGAETDAPAGEQTDEEAPAAARAARSTELPGPDDPAFDALPEADQLRSLQRAAQADPAALRRHLLRQKDYTRKTQSIADRARELDQREAALRQREATGGPPGPGQTGAPAAPTGALAGEPSLLAPGNEAHWVQWYQTAYGAEPTQAALIAAVTRQQTPGLVGEGLQPFLQQGAEVVQAQRQREGQEAVQRFETQYDSLCEAYPTAQTPEARDEIIQQLMEWRADDVRPGAVEKAYFALHGREIAAAAAQGGQTARKRTEEKRGRTPTGPPASSEKPRGDQEPEARTFADVERQQRKALAGKGMRPRSRGAYRD